MLRPGENKRVFRISRKSIPERRAHSAPPRHYVTGDRAASGVKREPSGDGAPPRAKRPRAGLYRGAKQVAEGKLAEQKARLERASDEDTSTDDGEPADKRARRETEPPPATSEDSRGGVESEDATRTPDAHVDRPILLCSWRHPRQRTRSSSRPR